MTRLVHLKGDLNVCSWPRIVVITGPGRRRGEELPICREQFTIGHSPANDLAIDDEGVSKYHAEFVLSDDSWLLRDLGSDGGSYVNGEEIDEILLEHGDTIRFGTSLFTFVTTQVRQRAVLNRAVSGDLRATNEEIAFQDTITDTVPKELVSSMNFDLNKPASALLEIGTTTLTETYESMRHAFYAVQRLLDSFDRPELVGQILDAVLNLIPCERVSVYLLSGNGLEWAGSRPSPPDGKEPISSRSVTSYVLDTHKSVIAVDALHDERWAHDSSIQLSMVRSLICVPVMAMDRIHGVLYVTNSSSAGAFETRELQIAAGIGVAAGMVLSNAELYWELQEQNLNLERKVTERTSELKEKNLELESVNRRLAELNLEKDEFLGMAAHDLKNLLGAISGHAKILKQGDAIPGISTIQTAERIDQAAGRMLSLLQDLLDINAIEQGAVVVQQERVDLNLLVREVCDGYAEPARTKNIRMNFQLCPSPILWTDVRAVSQIIDNLVSNAVKFSPKGRKIFIRTDSDQGSLRVEITDQGPGLSTEDHRLLFQKYARLKPQPTGGEHSTGLGLSIVKKLTDLVNGRIWCESRLGEGSSFILELPPKPHL